MTTKYKEGTIAGEIYWWYSIAKRFEDYILKHAYVRLVFIFVFVAIALELINFSADMKPLIPLIYMIGFVGTILCIIQIVTERQEKPASIEGKILEEYKGYIIQLLETTANKEGFKRLLKAFHPKEYCFYDTPDKEIYLIWAQRGTEETDILSYLTERDAISVLAAVNRLKTLIDDQEKLQ